MNTLKEDFKPDFVVLNGKITKFNKAKISIMSPGFTFAISVFEGLRGYWNKEKKILYIFRLKDHLDRLNFSIKTIALDSPNTKNFEIQLVNLIKKNNLKDNLYIRIQVYADDWGSMFSKGPIGSSIISYPRPRTDGYFKGRKFAVSSWRRNSEDTSPPRIKTTGNYFNGRLAGLEAIRNGYDGSIILNNYGCISEGPAGCIFIIREGKIITPSISSGILESITRDTIIKLANSELKIDVIQRSIGRTELYLAEEVFYCGTAMEIIPILSVDNILIGSGKPGPITRKIQKNYDNIIFGLNDKYIKWLTPIEFN